MRIGRAGGSRTTVVFRNALPAVLFSVGEELGGVLASFGSFCSGILQMTLDGLLLVPVWSPAYVHTGGTLGLLGVGRRGGVGAWVRERHGGDGGVLLEAEEVGRIR